MVQPDSAGRGGGLQPGDIVVAIDGRKPIESFSEMQRVVSSANAGQELADRARRHAAHLKATPSLRQGRTISATRTGSACSASAARWRRRREDADRVDPLPRCGLGVEEPGS
jgi:hypothetical protein